MPLETDKRDPASLQTFVDAVHKKILPTLTRNQLSAARDKYNARFGVGFLYEFTDKDLGRIQHLINELRDEAQRSSLEASHKQRFLEKLEVLQQELYKKMTRLDRFWTFVGEAGVMIGKLGTDAKPFVDRIGELLQIASRVQARSEKLPKGEMPKLPPLPPSESEDEPPEEEG